VYPVIFHHLFVAAQVEFETKVRKQSIICQFQALSSRRFQIGFDSVNLYCLTSSSSAFFHSFLRALYQGLTTNNRSLVGCISVLTAPSTLRGVSALSFTVETGYTKEDNPEDNAEGEAEEMNEEEEKEEEEEEEEEEERRGRGLGERS